MKIDIWMPHVRVAGGPRVVLTYAELLKKRGHEVTIFIPGRRWFTGLVPYRSPWGNTFTIQPTIVRDWSEACTHESDIVMADSWLVAKALIECDPQKPLFHFVQHDERLYHGDPEKVAEVYRSSRLKKIVVATWLKEMFEKDFSITPQLLLNTVDRAQFHPIPEARPNDGLLRILLLHHTYAWKGTAEGIAMIEVLKKTNPHIRSMLFGARKEESDMPCDEYYYNVPQSELAKIYSRADIFLCPSWGEGFGLPSLEAMACGTPVVTYDNGGSRDFAFHEKTALVAPARDIALLTRELGRLVDDPVLRRKITEEGCQFVETLPTWEEQAIKLEAVLNSR